jgi:hypothetical protein
LVRDRYKSAQEEGALDKRRTHFPVTLPSQAQFRTTRHIVGVSSLVTGQDGKYSENSIGLAPDWRKAGPIWEIPFGTLIPQAVTGLLTAGRCISASGDAWEVMRVIPVAAHTGQVAGIAATLAVKQRITPDLIAAANVQNQLDKKHIPYHIQAVRNST